MQLVYKNYKDITKNNSESELLNFIKLKST